MVQCFVHSATVLLGKVLTKTYCVRVQHALVFSSVLALTYTRKFPFYAIALNIFSLELMHVQFYMGTQKQVTALILLLSVYQLWVKIEGNVEQHHGHEPNPI